MIFGGLVIVGITPGRELLTTHLDVTFSLIWLLIIANVLTSVFCLIFTRQLAQVTMISPSVLVPLILAMAVVGSFAESKRFEDVLMMIAFGTLGYFMRASGWPRPPMLLGVVLGPLAERYLWTSVQHYGLWFLLRPGVLTIFALLLLSVLYPIFQDRISARIRARRTEI